MFFLLWLVMGAKKEKYIFFHGKNLKQHKKGLNIFRYSSFVRYFFCI